MCVEQQNMDSIKFADEKLNVTQIMISVFDIIVNIVEKEENADYQYFLLFPQCFQKPSSSSTSMKQDRVINSSDMTYCYL